ncbi:MAG: Crp/Fnr family transcriptional regulator [Pseudomonadota bacterium]
MREQNIRSAILRAALGDQDWAELLKSGRRLSFAKGQTIIARGSLADNLYVIESGRVEISVTLADGNKAALNQMGPGEVLGEIALLDGGPRSADAIAASTDVHLIAVSHAEIYRILEKSSDVLTALIRELCKRVRNASDMFEVKSEKSAEVRLARALLQLAAKWGRAGDGGPDGGTVIKGFSQSELGDLAGLARENVNRQLRLWEDDALIRRDGKTIILCDPDAIAVAAQL